MGQRNMLCTSQMFDMESHQLGHHHPHPEPCVFLGNAADFPRPDIYPLLSASGNTRNIDNGMFYRAHYNGLQHHHPVANLDFGGVPASYFYDPYMIPSSGRRMFPIPLNHGPTDHLPSSSNNGIIGVNLGESERNNYFMDCVRGSCKKKNAEGFSGNSQFVNGSTSSSSLPSGTSLSTGPHHCEQQFESGAGMLDVSAFPLPEFGGNGIVSVTEGGPPRSARIRCNPVGFQLDSTLLLNHHHLIQGNFIGQSFQPVGGALVEQQFRSNGGDGSASTWNYAPNFQYLHGRSVSGGSLEIGIIGAQGYPETTNGVNSAVPFYPSSISHQHSLQSHDHHHPSPPQVQGIQRHNFTYHHQVPTPSFWHRTNSTYNSNLNPPQDDTVPGSRNQRPLLPTGFRIYRPHRRAVQQAPLEDGHRPHLTILPEDEVAILDFPGFRDFGDHHSDLRLDIDHSDMRLDVDHMSYEELLALEERIGNVKIGLTQETITSHLKTRYHLWPAACINLDEPLGMDQEAEACIICQDEYENMDRIGTLDCGHEYHAECIKKWLLVKNVCPICKISAISVDSKDL